MLDIANIRCPEELLGLAFTFPFKENQSKIENKMYCKVPNSSDKIKTQ